MAKTETINRPSISIGATSYYPLFYWSYPSTQASVSNKAFSWMMAGNNLMFITGRFYIDNKEGAADTDSFTMTLPNGYVCDSANPSPFAISFNSNGAENFIIRTSIDKPYIFYTYTIGGQYSNPYISTGWHAFFGFIPVRKAA